MDLPSADEGQAPVGRPRRMEGLAAAVAQGHDRPAAGRHAVEVFAAVAPRGEGDTPGQSIDRKMPLEDIAAAKGMELPQLLGHLEMIVDSGTKVNIDYYIDEMLDEDAQDDIYDYFREAETDSVKEALDELGEDVYSEDDVRMMRIKFMSDEGN